jgi:hypothetical protein
MLVYPQLSSGALAQYPILKRNRQRTVVNTMADSTSIKLADPAGQVTAWQLKYAGLSDTEALALQQFFTATEGSLNAFTFLDPTANLLSWSEQLTNAVWALDPFLSITAGVTDPTGGTSGWLVSNSGAAAQTISQTLSAPGGYVYCFSVYGQSSQDTPVTLLCGTASLVCPSDASWNRLALTGTGDPTSQSVVFGVRVPPGATVNIFGLQVEAQAAASLYKPSETGGVYENANFRDDVFMLTTTDVNRNSAIVNIIHANSLSA